MARITIPLMLLWLAISIIGFLFFLTLFDDKPSYQDLLEVIEKMKEDNEHLRQTIQENEKFPIGHKSSNHERIRRSITNGIVEFWYTIKNKLRIMEESLKKFPIQTSYIDDTIGDLKQHYNSLLTYTKELSDVDGARKWRTMEISKLSDKVQKNIRILQYPRNCSEARKLVCDLNKECGFGCQIHHLTYCLLTAYEMNRTFVLQSFGWKYSHKGWEKFFIPVSNCTADDYIHLPTLNNTKNQESINTLYLPIIDLLADLNMQHLPLSFPQQIAEELIHLHSYPPVWWIGQFVSYLMRYQLNITSRLKAISEELYLRHRYVGVHIRRTDKLVAEASFHFVEEYMEHVDDWFQLHSTPADEKRIYLATDDPTIIEYIRRKYPDYIVLTDENSAISAHVENRYSDSSLLNLINDVHFLANSDFLVCTFSSQVCRLAYELMQAFRNDDVANNFKSLDDIYYFGGQLAHEQEVLIAHQSKNTGSNKTTEIELAVGDVVGVGGNHWNGYFMGTNRRTNKSGLYPTCKVKEKWRLHEFPRYF